MTPARVNAGLVTLALALMAGIATVTGRIPVNQGQGWDGSDYADMALYGWAAGTANTALRPLVVLLNRPAVRAAGDVVTGFRLMNYLYAAVLALVLCLLMDQYGAAARVKTIAVANLFASIAFAKFFAFYAVLIDLGALALLSVAVWLIVRGRRVAAGAACVLAVLAREFAIAAIVFGVHRDLRSGRRWSTVALTYAPAAAAFVGLRWLVARRWSSEEGGEMLTAVRLVSNLRLWEDPVFAGLFVYFLLTIAGGLSLFVFARFGAALPRLRREPEWATFATVVLAAAVVGDADIWRYIAYLAPAIVVLFAWCAESAATSRAGWTATAALISVATLVTQRPYAAIDIPAYFRDWFPYYVHRGNVPFEPVVPLWPLWGWRMLSAVALFWALTLVIPVPRRSTAAPTLQPLL